MNTVESLLAKVALLEKDIQSLKVSERETCNCTKELESTMLLQDNAGYAGWREALKAWRVCADVHKAFAKGKDSFFQQRQLDFQANIVAVLAELPPEI